MRRTAGKNPHRTSCVRFWITLFWAITVFDASEALAQSDAGAFIARIESPQSPAGTELDALTLQALMERLHVPGLSIAVVKDFHIHWAKAYGVADVETGRLLDTDTRFQAASMSKPVTALAAMRLVQEHRLDLDADVNTMLKSWHVPRSELTRNQKVTPRSLFSHTSGADDGFGFLGYEPNMPLPTLVQILDGLPPSNVGKIKFARPPFEASKYSGGGLMIMQLALTELTGRPFAQFMQSTEFAPLQMANSSFEPPSTVADTVRTALAHDVQGRRMDVVWHVYPEQAAAGLWTTPSDLAKFIIEIQTALRGSRGKVLNQQTAREMIAPVGVGRFAIGVAIDQRGDGWYFSHGGSNWGYRAWMIGHVRKGYGVVIMTNGDNGLPLMNQVADRVVAAYQWDSLEKPPPQ
jgi:CubicO group peptidase (beta-lactamase class C family)